MFGSTRSQVADKGLDGIRVLDFSDQIAGPYCSKLLCDAGAHVIKVESASGDSLRHWTASGQVPGPEGSALFRFLNAGKESVVGTPSDEAIQALVARADLVIQAHGLETDRGQTVEPASLREAHPSIVVLSITPYGLTGPWAGRRATEFSLQAESGSIALRGLMGGQPFQAGGRLAEWAAGTYVEVAWGPLYNHGGGYQYRLCPAGEALTEECFQRTPLEFDRSKQTLVWNTKAVPGADATTPPVQGLQETMSSTTFQTMFYKRCFTTMFSAPQQLLRVAVVLLYLKEERRV